MVLVTMLWLSLLGNFCRCTALNTTLIIITVWAGGSTKHMTIVGLMPTGRRSQASSRNRAGATATKSMQSSELLLHLDLPLGVFAICLKASRPFAGLAL